MICDDPERRFKVIWKISSDTAVSHGPYTYYVFYYRFDKKESRDIVRTLSIGADFVAVRVGGGYHNQNP